MSYLPQNINLPLALRSEVSNTGGIDAGFTGSTNTAVLLFTVAGTVTGPTSYITETNSATLGTEVLLTEPGVYEAKLYVEGIATADVFFGISQDVAVAGLTSTPAFAIAGFIDVQHRVVAAAGVDGVSITSTVMVTPEQEGGTTVRFHAADTGDVAPTLLTAATAYYRIRRINQLHE